MARKTAEQCIENILKDIEFRKSVDYADREAVRRYNAAYDRIFKNISYIDVHYPEKIALLVTLCHHADLDITTHCAPMILRLTNASVQQKQEAISIIEELVDGHKLNSAAEFGFAISLKRWKAELSV